jgi:bifunctional non-homologous end joining protein LigD
MQFGCQERSDRWRSSGGSCGRTLRFCRLAHKGGLSPGLSRRVRPLKPLNGVDLRQRPIEERRSALSPLVAGVDHVLFSDVLVAEGALVFVKACELGLEGIVSKRVGSRHSSGNSRQWVKSKNPAFER